MRTFWILVFSLMFVAVGIMLVPDPPPPVRADTDSPSAPYKPYTFPSVVHTPEAMAQARLLCAAAGDQGWAMAYQRQRTGMTLEEALALVHKEHGVSPEVRPLERVATIVYWHQPDHPRAAPEKVRESVQRVCLDDMLGAMADPPSAAPASVATTTPPTAPPNAAKKNAPRH